VTGAEFAAEYQILVRRYPDMTNEQIAQRLGMTRMALVQALYRGRKAGRITIWRVAHGHEVGIALPGNHLGYERSTDRDASRRKRTQRERAKKRRQAA
jgi:hypothetical protein